MRQPNPDSRTRLGRRVRLLPSPFWLLFLIFAQCILDDRHAGTSTSVTNPAALVTGFAILDDGTLAAGARVTLRRPIIEVSNDGTPSSREVAYAIADSLGKFTIPAEFLVDVYMEIREAPGTSRGLPPDSQEVCLRRWDHGMPFDGKMGTFRLEAQGTLTGHIETPETSSTVHRWVGVRGTDNFIPAPDRNPFRLGGVPAGRRDLVIVTVPDTSVWAANPDRVFVVADSVAADTVKPGRNTDFGSVFYTND
jgi:hypothetical protein